jgi:glycosyltransferase involved in cell wall biosynthesis
MKILLIHGVHFPAGGADKVYLNSGELLEKNGHKVIYFSFKNKKNIYCSQEKYFLDEPSKFRIFLNMFYNKQAAIKIEQLICDEKPDIAHLHSFWSGMTPSICIVLRKYNIPIVHSVHDYNLICPVTTSTDNKGNICEECKGKYFYKCVIKRCFKGSFFKSLILASALFFRIKLYDPLKLIDGFVFVSWFAYYQHLKYMPDLIKSNAIILYNFNPFTPISKVDKYNRMYFLYLGRLSHEKGLLTLIMAFSQVKDIRLKIVGTGPQETLLKDTVKKLGVDNIEFVGFKSGDELKSIISNASFNIVPSEWWENNPLSIIEAYSVGVPVIGAKIGGIPEIIVNGETGYLFEMKNVDHLTRVINKANSLSTEDYVTMSNNAVEFAWDKFSEEQYVNILVDFYEKMIQKIRNSSL